MLEYLRLVRFSHTLFALPFALLGALMAVGTNLYETPAVLPRIVDFAGVLLCMVFARSTAMAFNRIVDRKFDARNPRTVSRHLPSGRLSVWNVTVFTVICAVGFVVSTLLFLPNVIPIIFAVPVLAFLCGYSFAKRFTWCSHLWLGLSLGLSPFAAWVVFRSELIPVPLPPLLLCLAVMFWTAAFDIIYAFQDKEVDIRENLYSIPRVFRTYAAWRLVVLFHVLMIACLLFIPQTFPLFGNIWYFGVAIVALILAGEHWTVVPHEIFIRPFLFWGRHLDNDINWRGEPEIDLRRIDVAFFKLNAIVSSGMMVVGILDLVW
ncbi:MAG: putative 4-hydroxybenzoate polyprenyltransferase [Planctomycetaceae bacterium]|jgi:4-hydroxybenzoate polyprenyltransferase|nr:putative 4-hydroxybenzoate polyprenyltransferase [Planctomycetaceae bacterium]